MSASHGMHSACATGTAERSPPVPVEDPVRKACTAEECRVHSACAGNERSQHRRDKVGGRARRRALCARCSRLVRQVSLRASRHARTHEHLMHHTAMDGMRTRLVCSQAAARQWSSHTMDVYGCTSREQFELMVVHAVVQWFASDCCVCRPRAIARSTSHNACAARVMRG